MKRKKYVWYSVELDAIFLLDKEATIGLTIMSLRHDFRFNEKMMFLGEL
jgi:hypothetical protein